MIFCFTSNSSYFFPKSIEMKKSNNAKPGNKGKQINNVKAKAPVMHDDNQRRQPPTPQDIARVQPVSQAHHKNQLNNQGETDARKGPK
jgi:hypothetical protein